MLDVVRRSGPTARLSSVRNAARLLKEFSRSDRELGVTQLARRLGLAVSTVHRLLSTLTDEGLLERGSVPGTYRLGLQMYELGATVFPNLDLHEAALPVLAALRQTTGETVQMGVLDHLEVVYLERLESPQTLRVFNHSGHRIPAPATSSGKVLLAALPADVLQARLLDWRPERRTSEHDRGAGAPAGRAAPGGRAGLGAEHRGGRVRSGIGGGSHPRRRRHGRCCDQRRGPDHAGQSGAAAVPRRRCSRPQAPSRVGSATAATSTAVTKGPRSGTEPFFPPSETAGCCP